MPVEALADLLRSLLLVAYGALAFVALWQYQRNRQRPAAFLAAAFGVLAATLAYSRTTTALGLDSAAFGLPTVIGLAAFPWLLAAVAWSFDGRLPRWLRAASGYLVPLAGLYLWSRTSTRDAERSADDVVFLVVFLVGWLVPAVATVGRLWRAGRHTSRVVRARMRLLAGSLFALTLAIVLAVAAPPGRAAATAAANGIALLAALLAMAGFAPPLPLRLWWRRQGAQHFQQMQERLIAAVTPQACAEAVAPTLANHVGAGVAVMTPDGGLLASAGIDPAEVPAIIADADDPTTDSGSTQVFATRHATLVVRLTPYSPLFGDTERELTGAYAWQLQLALERSEYAAKHLAARREIERAKLGQVAGEVEAVDLGQLARGVRDRIVVGAPHARVEVADALPTAHVDPVRAEQVLDNLLGNAVKHAGGDAVHVVVEARPAADGFDLLVRDDGRGIPQGERDRVFDLFQRGSQASAPGTGIGLGMVRRIVEQWGGTIRLEDVDRGACFVLHLPHDVLRPATAPRRLADRSAAASVPRR